jgi:hypothetical protein
MGSLLFAALLCAAPEPVKVAAPGFSLAGVDPTLGAVFQERFVSRLGSPELRVTSQRDIQQVLGLERQKQLLGCTGESSSCLAELAGALGVDLVLSGSVARSESGYIASIRVIRADDGQLVASPNVRTKTEGAFLDWLDATADSLRATILQKLRGQSGAPVEVAAVTRPPVIITRWIPAMVGGAAVIVGGVFFGLAVRNYFGLLNYQVPGPAGPNGPSIQQLTQQGTLYQTVGLLTLGLGAAAIAASVLWNALAPTSPVRVSLVLIPGSGALGFAGVLP